MARAPRVGACRNIRIHATGDQLTHIGRRKIPGIEHQLLEPLIGHQGYRIQHGGDFFHITGMHGNGDPNNDPIWCVHNNLGVISLLHALVFRHHNMRVRVGKIDLRSASGPASG